MQSVSLLASRLLIPSETSLIALGAVCEFAEGSPEPGPSSMVNEEGISEQEEPILTVRRGKRPAHVLEEAFSPAQKASGPQKIKNLRSVLKEKSSGSTEALSEALLRVEKLEEKMENSQAILEGQIGEFGRLLKELNSLLE